MTNPANAREAFLNHLKKIFEVIDAGLNQGWREIKIKHTGYINMDEANRLIESQYEEGGWEVQSVVMPDGMSFILLFTEKT